MEAVSCTQSSNGITRIANTNKISFVINPLLSTIGVFSPSSVIQKGSEHSIRIRRSSEKVPYPEDVILKSNRCSRIIVNSSQNMKNRNFFLGIIASHFSSQFVHGQEEEYIVLNNSLHPIVKVASITAACSVVVLIVSLVLAWVSFKDKDDDVIALDKNQAVKKKIQHNSKRSGPKVIDIPSDKSIRTCDIETPPNMCADSVVSGESYSYSLEGYAANSIANNARIFS